MATDDVVFGDVFHGVVLGVIDVAQVLTHEFIADFRWIHGVGLSGLGGGVSHGFGRIGPYNFSQSGCE